MVSIDDGSLTLTGSQTDGTALVAQGGGADLDAAELIEAFGTTTSAGSVAVDAAQITITDILTASNIALNA